MLVFMIDMCQDHAEYLPWCPPCNDPSNDGPRETPTTLSPLFAPQSTGGRRAVGLGMVYPPSLVLTK